MAGETNCTCCHRIVQQGRSSSAGLLGNDAGLPQQRGSPHAVDAAWKGAKAAALAAVAGGQGYGRSQGAEVLHTTDDHRPQLCIGQGIESCNRRNNRALAMLLCGSQM